MCHASLTKAFIAFGANLAGPYGNAQQTVAAGIDALRNVASHDLQISRFFRTPAFPQGSGPEFVNAAVALDWAGTAAELHAHTQEIEERFGRTRTRRWEARVLDLDILGIGDQILPDQATEAHWRGLSAETASKEAPKELILPHPRLAERGFVLVPLMDVAPDWVHPALGLSVTQMCAALPAADRDEIMPI